MKISDCTVGMEVVSKNRFATLYVITEVGDKTVDLEHRTGQMIMQGGKLVEEVFVYKNRSPSYIEPAACS